MTQSPNRASPAEQIVRPRETDNLLSTLQQASEALRPFAEIAGRNLQKPYQVYATRDSYRVSVSLGQCRLASTVLGLVEEVLKSSRTNLECDGERAATEGQQKSEGASDVG